MNKYGHYKNDYENISHLINSINDMDSDNIFRYKMILQELVKQATPPTAEEVCEAFSEWFKEDVQYDDEEEVFHIDNIAISYLYKDIDKTNDEIEIQFECSLPPYIIKMIVLFYERR